MIPITHPFRKVREKDGAPGDEHSRRSRTRRHRSVVVTNVTNCRTRRVLDFPVMILIQHELETLREVATAMLTQAGYECRATTSPTEAWDIINSGEAIELLLCKVMESLENGLIESVSERFPNTPVVVWGCRPLPPFLEAMGKGAYDYLQVPFMREQLLAVVRRGLDNRP